MLFVHADSRSPQLVFDALWCEINVYRVERNDKAALCIVNNEKWHCTAVVTKLNPKYGAISFNGFTGLRVGGVEETKTANLMEKLLRIFLCQHLFYGSAHNQR